MMPERVAGLEDLARRFDCFLVDQFGVLLDGTGAYPGAAAALSRLAAMGKRIVLLSNSGKRSGPNEARLDRLGFERNSYLGVMSSGEVAWQMLNNGRFADIPADARTLLISRDGDRSPVEGLALRLVDDASSADLILLSGSEGDVVTLDQYQALLAPAAARGVPCLCTNPDMTMLTAVGQRFGAGRIAELYAELGGPVHYVGKPHPPIYDAALRRLGDPAPTDVVAIGDSPDHDIVGGKTAGIRTGLVRTGLHLSRDEDAIMAHCRDIGAMPDFILPSFAFAEGEG